MPVTKKTKAALGPSLLTATENYSAAMARIGATLDLKELDDADRAFLATCQKIQRRWAGSNTPFEEFFNELVTRVQHGRWPTPDDVQRELETFRENFEDMQRDVALFRETYPKAAIPEDTEGGKEGRLTYVL